MDPRKETRSDPNRSVSSQNHLQLVNDSEQNNNNNNTIKSLKLLRLIMKCFISPSSLALYATTFTFMSPLIVLPVEARIGQERAIIKDDYNDKVMGDTIMAPSESNEQDGDPRKLTTVAETSQYWEITSNSAGCHLDGEYCIWSHSEAGDQAYGTHGSCGFRPKMKGILDVKFFETSSSDPFYLQPGDGSAGQVWTGTNTDSLHDRHTDETDRFAWTLNGGSGLGWKVCFEPKFGTVFRPLAVRKNSETLYYIRQDTGTNVAYASDFHRLGWFVSWEFVNLSEVSGQVNDQGDIVSYTWIRNLDSQECMTADPNSDAVTMDECDENNDWQKWTQTLISNSFHYYLLNVGKQQFLAVSNGCSFSNDFPEGTGLVTEAPSYSSNRCDSGRIFKFKNTFASTPVALQVEGKTKPFHIVHDTGNNALVLMWGEGDKNSIPVDRWSLHNLGSSQVDGEVDDKGNIVPRVLIVNEASGECVEMGSGYGGYGQAFMARCDPTNTRQHFTRPSNQQVSDTRGRFYNPASDRYLGISGGCHGLGQSTGPTQANKLNGQPRLNCGPSSTSGPQQALLHL